MPDLRNVIETKAVTVEQIFLSPNSFYVIPDYQMNQVITIIL